ncbi:MAG: TetR/AcrR family transcriptional regulator [Solirubrobacteraceae bacterium]|nr:TetR/AcrR family transcriptional regulator [Solirubrobacteraceae bacterium]
MPHSTQRKPDRRRERTHAAIVSAAERLFFEQGVARTTTDDIAALAGVSVGSIYAHFNDKHTLFVSLVDRAFSLNERYIVNRTWAVSPLKRLMNTGEAYLRFAEEETAAFYLTTMRVREPSESPAILGMEANMTERMGRIARQIGSDVAAAIEAGEIEPVPVETALMYLWGSWAGVISMHLRVDEFHAEHFNVRESLALGATVLTRGLGGTPPPSREPVARAA